MNPYMATKKTGPTLAALNAQIAKLQAQAEALRAKEVAGVVARIREAIVHYGLTVADLGFGSAKSKAPKGAAVTAAPKSKGKTAGKKTARTIKPELKARDAYEAQYARYTKIYPAIKEIYRQ